MKKIRKYHLVALIFCIKAMFQQNLGDYIIYSGKRYMIHNGVRANSWRLGNLDNNDDGWVLRSECRKVMTLSNMTRSFKSKWRFYKTSWFSIWESTGRIGNFAKSCNIWGGYKWRAKK